MKHIFIINPISGNHKEIHYAIKKVCEQENIDYQIYFTRESKDATEITKKFKNSENIIYSVGGDGTLNEVVNGIVGSKNKLAIIPVGSGNDFYKTMKNNHDPNPKIDIGMINNDYFINIASIGLDAEIANKANQLRNSKVPANQVYNISIGSTFLNYKCIDVELKIDNQQFKQGITIFAICNGRYYGNGFKIAPNAILDDGFFDIYLVDKMNKLVIPSVLVKLIKGTHEESKYVHKILGNEINIKSDDFITYNIDGEIKKEKECKIKVLKKEVEIYNNRYLIEKIIND